MPRGANMSLALNALKLFVQIQRLPPSIHHHKGKETINTVWKTTELLMKDPIELKDDSTMVMACT
jgi:hypothetical protein